MYVAAAEDENRPVPSRLHLVSQAVMSAPIGVAGLHAALLTCVQAHQPILRPHIADVVHDCQIVVVSQKRPEFTAALQALNGRATVLDLVRLSEEPAALGVSMYRGMSW